jgi:4-alpha-glucanotransferase
MTKSYGLLMHISSLPTKEPVGTIGLEAYQYLDFLEASGATYWQILPLHPVDLVYSPYASASAFAGEVRYIDIKLLNDEELTEHYNIVVESLPEYTQANYSIAMQIKIPILKEYYERQDTDLDEVLETFQSNHPWVWDYCLFEALKTQFGNKSWPSWPEGIRLRDPHSLDFYGKLLSQDIRFGIFLQYLFFTQWSKLKKEANKRNISIVGDLPIYVPLDSADVWCNPSLFALDDAMHPRWVSGAPPDYFTPLGQKWNTPVYDWSNHHQNGYAWWKQRIAHSFQCFDLVRLDHFRGFESFWAIPPEDEDARGGHWKMGPGGEFLQAIKEAFPEKNFIVEDLGNITPEVDELKRFFGHPGMSVLQFAFDGNLQNPHLPQQITPQRVYYSGTHDNPPLPSWLESLSSDVKALVTESLHLQDQDMNDALLEIVLNSPAAFSILQFQDLLPADPTNRMNTPGTVKYNWLYKVPWDLDIAPLTEKLQTLTNKKPLE